MITGGDGFRDGSTKARGALPPLLLLGVKKRGKTRRIRERIPYRQELYEVKKREKNKKNKRKKR